MVVTNCTPVKPIKPDDDNSLKCHNACAEPNSRHAPKWGRSQRGKRIFRLGVVAAGYLVVVATAAGIQLVQERVTIAKTDFNQILHRGRRELVEKITTSKAKSTINNSDPGTPKQQEKCEPRAINNFPDNFLSHETCREGGVALHVAIAVYMFIGLALVTDDYFVPALEILADDLGLQPDVAGATLMAAGSSAPELAVSIVGVFFAKDDIGIGTIVGSAVFNVLFCVGLIGVCCGQALTLTVWPLLRDSLFYMLSVALLYVAVVDQAVHWWEALLMVLMYALYVFMMYCNPRLQLHANRLGNFIAAKFSSKGPATFAMTQSSYKSFEDDKEQDGTNEVLNSQKDIDKTLIGNSEDQFTLDNLSKSQCSEAPVESLTKDGASSDKDTKSPWVFPDTLPDRVTYVLSFPFTVLFYFTIPPIRDSGIWSRLAALTFLLSLVWISVLTYVMVWMITIAGDVMGIPDTVMGLTLVTAGSSVPDCLASICVARNGLGDMAVSNAIGSNSFDILFCLGLVWLIRSATTGLGDIPINSTGLVYSTLTLLATVAFLPTSLALNKMRLTPKYGGLCIAVYVLVTVLMCLYELGVIGGGAILPVCPR